ncbi:alpha/beta fold hydrolase [Pseudonocardia spinosispora]|uniref:alpha/beta fold hydrolase n=1 Tax=Pseudonocardia spinosispora TaxID=103441 RepID=UPI000409E81F|nr:alpha/beta fold hydrolase [Pseudonocardia spinosispora]
MRSSHLGVFGTGTPLAVLLPGSGSDEVFVRAAFTDPLRTLGYDVHAPAPGSGAGVVQSYLDALDEAAKRGVPLVVGGVSLGAQVAARWAAARSSRGDRTVVGLLLALPAWTGPPSDAPAALAASLTASAVRRDGLAATVAATRAQTPDWLGAELARAWSGHGSGLADSLDAAAASPGPDAADLTALRVPVGLVGMTDDPIHPLSVAEDWLTHLPRAALVTMPLRELGADPANLGRAATTAWLRAGGGAG